MEATISETVEEGTQEVSSAVTETAGSTEQAPEIGETSEVDWNDESLFKDIPDDARELAKQYGEKVFKRAYTKKTQSLAAEKREWEQRQAEFESQRAEFQRVASEVLRDPTKYEQYRSRYGYATPQAPVESVQDKLDILNIDPNNLPEDFTVGDLIKSIQGLEKKIANQTMSTAKEVINQETANRSYNMAMKSHLKDGFFSQNEDVILHIARTDPKLKAMYNPQEGNDYDVLEAAKVKYKERINGYLEAQKQEILKSEQVKKSASTLRPQKPVQTITKSQNTGGIVGQVDTADILNAVMNRRPDLF